MPPQCGQTGSPFGIGPTDAPEGHFGFLVLHPEDLGQREGLGGAGKEEMLGHLHTYRL